MNVIEILVQVMYYFWMGIWCGYLMMRPIWFLWCIVFCFFCCVVFICCVVASCCQILFIWNVPLTDPAKLSTALWLWTVLSRRTMTMTMKRTRTRTRTRTTTRSGGRRLRSAQVRDTLLMGLASHKCSPFTCTSLPVKTGNLIKG